MRGRKDTPRGGAAKASLSAGSREIARLRRVLWSARVSARSFLAAKWQNHRDRKERGRSWKRLSPWVQQLRQQRARGVAVFSPRGALSSRGLFAGSGWACLYIMYAGDCFLQENGTLWHWCDIDVFGSSKEEIFNNFLENFAASDSIIIGSSNLNSRSWNKIGTA